MGAHLEGRLHLPKTAEAEVLPRECGQSIPSVDVPLLGSDAGPGPDDDSESLVLLTITCYHLLTEVASWASYGPWILRSRG